jgi:uncharacterized protein (TIGR03083 family)
VDWTWVGPPIDVRALFPAERLELLSVLRDLNAAGWRRPTACPGWTVHDLAAHLVHDYLRRLSNTRDRSASAGPAPGEALPAFLARVNQEFVDVARRFSHTVLVDLLEHLGPQLDRTWAGLDLSAVGDVDVWWADPGAPAPVWLDVAREYSEFWVHQQQIRDAAGRPAADDPMLVGPVIDTFMRGLPNALRLHPAASGSSVRVQVQGPGGGTWVATRGPSRWRLDTPNDRPTEALVQVSPDTLWRLASRDLSPEQARERATISGDETLASAALQLLSIIR